jgi:IclR family transcriptional regulator, KDG regulon repressor
MSGGAKSPNGPNRQALRMTDRAIKSAERTLAVFEIFSQEQRGLRVGEVSRGLGIPQPSVSMLLRNLTRLGYLSYDPQRRTFSPTIRLALLGSWLDRQFEPGGGLVERLLDLQAEVGNTVYVGMQNGSSLQYVLAQENGQAGHQPIKSGQMRPLPSCASGQVLLSLKSDTEIRGWIRRANAELTEGRQRVRERDFLQLMHGVRRNGYAQTAGDGLEGLGEIAVSIMSPVENRALAIAVGGAPDRLDRQRHMIIPALNRFKSSLGQRKPALVVAA